LDMGSLPRAQEGYHDGTLRPLAREASEARRERETRRGLCHHIGPGRTLR